MKLTATGAAAKPHADEVPTRKDKRIWFPVGGPSNDGARWIEPGKRSQPCLECGEPCRLLAGRGAGNYPLAAWVCDRGCRVPPIWLRAYDAAWAVGVVERGPKQRGLFDEEVPGAG